ncbi:hypothetical protein KAR52_03270, partial [Candidatus Pacearchaeota archaeon]|nr:hypothetical protein [Candidatus Pacearchaeota archaeon]
MVYKKYIKRGGKIYGPYNYHSRKVNGKVITEYLGKSEEKNKNKLFLIFFVIGLISLFSLIFILNYNEINFASGTKFADSISNVISYSLTSIKTMTGFVISDGEEPETDENLAEEVVTENTEEPVEEEIAKEELEEEPVEEIVVEEVEEEEPIEEFTEELIEQNETEEIPTTAQEIVNESKEIINEVDNKSISESNLTHTNVNETVSENITIEDQIITPEENEEEIEETESEIIIEQNITEVPIISETNITNITETNAVIVTTQYQAVIGKPVKWKKTVSLEEPKNLTLKLPAGSKNINVKKINDKEITTSKITGQVIGGESKGFFTKLFEKLFRLTGGVIGVEETQEEVEVELDDTAKEYEVEYETPAPYAVEEEIVKGKRVKVVGPENVHYENVLAFTNLDEALNIKNPSKVKIHWIEDNSHISVQSIKDTDGNGIYDYVEWIVPHLSEQTFEIIIEITTAEHLDSDRNFISDIYDEVYQLDDIWSEEIPDGDYVRVTFETELDFSKDITIYPRIISGNPRVEVYEVDGTEIIAEFTTIIPNELNKIYLTNLVGLQDTFDLKIVGGSLEFDYIVDPPASLSDDSVTVGTTPINEGGTTTVTILYTNTKDPGTWESITITEAGADTNVNIITLNCLGDNTGFKVTDIDITGAVSATDNGDGSIALSGNPSSETVIWTIQACSSANSDSPYIITHQCNGCTDVVVFNANGALAVNAVSDTVNPQFTNYKENPDNNTVYSFGAEYRFNSTIIQANGTVELELAETNYSSFNSTGTVFNTTVTDLSAGTHPYYWWAYGNGTSTNYNTSEARS